MADIIQQIVQAIPRLRRYARALTGDTNRADDLVQDTLERAWSRLHLWRESGDLRAWLFTILHNVFANNARRYSREPTWVPLSETVLPGEIQPPLEVALDLHDLQVALAKLSKEQREILLLVGLEQMSYHEVATILQLPIGTVMSRLARARERLRQLLQETTLHPPLRRMK